MRLSPYLLRIVFALSLSAGWGPAQDLLSKQPPIWKTNPTIEQFQTLENARLEAAVAMLAKVTAAQTARTIDNTLKPFDATLREISAAGNLAGLMQQVHPDAKFRDAATAMTDKVSALQTSITLNRDVYNALRDIDLTKADEPTKYYLQRTLLLFRLAGVDKDDATRKKLQELNDRITAEQSAFGRNIDDGTKSITVSSVAELDGMPQDYIERHKPAPDGAITLTTDYPDSLPVMKFAKSDSLRKQMSIAFETRAFPKNKEVLEKLLKDRFAVAQLLGYPSWADYNAADKMVGKGDRIAQFISEIDGAARPIADRETEMLLKKKREIGGSGDRLMEYEMNYLTELVRRSDFDFDSQSVRPYLPYAGVRQGILDTAATLFHLSFRQEKDAGGWDASVETWTVLDGGRPIGRIYLDMHPRPGKFSHAEMVPVLEGVRSIQLPEAVLVCNFPKPTAGDPGLMEYSDVVTFFHEFGHLMHWMLSGQQQWTGISAISMEGDFVEAPSQMLEEWMHSPQVLASFAKNYKTGEPLPASVVAKMNRASAFNRGNDVMRQNSFTAISYDLYKQDPAQLNLRDTCVQDALKYTKYLPTPDAEMYASFGHLAGYSSAYYTYMWDKVIAEDFFNQFNKQDLLHGDVPMRYRHEVLEPGGSMPAGDLVKHFLGRAQNMSAFQSWIGAEFAAQ